MVGNSAKSDFHRSGPRHLSVVDWNNPDHRRSVAASLTQGVYVLRKDLRRNQPLAPPWWEFFHFVLQKKLVDDEDGSICGAIFRHRDGEPGRRSNQHGSPPKYVIAFRGTKNLRDVELDLKLCKNGLHETSRFKIGMKAVGKKVDDAGGRGDVWVAGHSLGAAIAMLAGRKMAITRGIFLEAFLFNPPFPSAPIENIIKQERAKHYIRVASSFIKAGLALAAERSSQQRRQSEEFEALSGWKPRLFVNPADIICSRYVGYFEHRGRMEGLGLERVERLATQTSIRDLLFSAIGRKPVAFYLIPSAYLTVNSTSDQNLKSAHGLLQWWEDMELHGEQYQAI